MQYILSPGVVAGRCLPLQGPKAYVDIKLGTAVHLEAVTYEHLPPSVAPNAAPTAPKTLAVYASLGASKLRSGDAPLLGTYDYDISSDANLQTFAVSSSGLIDHVRVAVSTRGGGGGDDLCCLYRIRVHGRLV
jgi:hypothetical protein